MCYRPQCVARVRGVLPNPGTTVQLSASTLSRMHAILGRVDEDSVLAKRMAELQALESELRDALDGDVHAWVNTIPGTAQEAVRNLYDAGGKRLRPVLALLCGGAAGGQPRAALPVAAAVELLHTGTLLHDDIVDEGDIRRGRPTARRVWGNALAVLAGDFCYFAALDALLDHGDHEILKRAMSVARALSEGELIQLQRRGSVSFDGEQAYFDIIDRKTASLMAFATWGGSRCAGGDDATNAALDTFGRQLGLAFQVVDDILDFAGDPAVFGKALGQDVVEGTVTLPLTYALELEPSLQADVRVLIETFHRERGGDERDDIEHTDVPDATDIVERVRQSGALERSRETAAQLTGEAITALDAVPDSPYRRGLTLLGASLLDRVS